jgi:hypothetical protein
MIFNFPNNFDELLLFAILAVPLILEQLLVITIGISEFTQGLYPVTYLISVGIVLVWIYSIGMGLVSKPNNYSQMVKRYLFVFSMVVMALCPIYVVSSGRLNWSLNSAPTESLISDASLGFIPIVAFLYSLFFVSGVLSGVEEENGSTNSNRLKYFFLVWYFPIGVWFVQPKLNKYVERNV